MLQFKSPKLPPKLLSALMVTWDKSEKQVLAILNRLEAEYKMEQSHTVIHLEHNGFIENDLLIGAWDRSIPFIDWCVVNNIDVYSSIIPGRVFNKFKQNYIEYIITSKAMLYKLLRSYPADIDQVLAWNSKSSVNEFSLDEKVKFFFGDKQNKSLAPTTKRRVEGYCPNAFFNYIVCYDEAYMCCSGWHASKSMGNPSEKSLREIWNSEEATLFRRSIIDGSYRYCLDDTCNFLVDKNYHFPSLDHYHNSIQRDILRGDGVMSHGPAYLNCGFDMSCNLSCPSCRTEPLIETGKRAEKIQDIEHEIEKMGSFFHGIYISGSGDIFGSPYSKNFLRRMSQEKFPQLKSLNLHSNGQLFTQRNWLQLPQYLRDRHVTLEVSLDGASKQTIECNRRGTTFDKLMKNLNFIADLRKNHEIAFLNFSFVVQDNNVHEMSDFVEFCTELNADCISFTKLLNWGSFSEKEYEDKAIHLITHPRHQELLDMLNEGNLYNENVTLGNLSSLINNPMY